jgi:hypothetical protein
LIEPGDRIQQLARIIDLEEQQRATKTLVAAFRDAPDDHVLSAMCAVGGSCVKLGQRLTNLGESLKDTAWGRRAARNFYATAGSCRNRRKRH